MKYDLTAIQNFLNESGLMNRVFSGYSVEEIENFCEAVTMAKVQVDYRVPFIKNGDLFLPMDAHPRHKYWDGGQSLEETLTEIGADPDVIKKYCKTPHSEPNKNTKEESEQWKQ